MSDNLIGVDPNYDPEKVTQIYLNDINEAIASNALKKFSDKFPDFIEAQRFDPNIDELIYKQGESRTDVRMIILIDTEGNRNEVFVKPLFKQALDDELIAHELCTELKIKHFVPIAVIENGNETYMLTEKVNIRPLSTISIKSLIEFEKRARKCVGVLKKLHDRGMLHKDAKPKNFAFDDQENVYIYDFQDSIYTPGVPASNEDREHEIRRFLRELKFYVKLHSIWGKDTNIQELLDDLIETIIADYFNDRI